jgi:hypothetical protein
VDTLSPAGLIGRVVATVLGAVLLLAGTVLGSDDDFPFGPFRMFAGVNNPNEDAPDTRVEGVDGAGRRLVLGEKTTGIRRAEIEGNLLRYTEQPELLVEVAEAYRQRHPHDPPVVEVRLIVRWHQIRSSRPTGRYHDATVAVWRAP